MRYNEDSLGTPYPIGILTFGYLHKEVASCCQWSPETQAHDESTLAKKCHKTG